MGAPCSGVAQPGAPAAGEPDGARRRPFDFVECPAIAVQILEESGTIRNVRKRGSTIILTGLARRAILGRRMSKPQSQGLSKERILGALSALDEKFAQKGIVGEVCVFGGTAMVLAFNARLSTKDVDAVFSPRKHFAVVPRLSPTKDLPEDWLNDSVKGFVSETGTLTKDDLPQFPNLRVIRPTAEYLSR